MISEKTLTEQTARLIDEYGQQWTLLRTVSLSQSCTVLNDEVFSAAIARHIADTRPGSDGQPVGSWPPKTAQVLYHAYEIEMEQRRVAVNAQGYPAAWDEESDQTYLAAQQGQRPRLRGQNCRSCSDSGLSRFYYDPRHRSWRVWIYMEWREMAQRDMALVRGLFPQSCVCDCPIGLGRSERLLVCRIPMETGRPYSLWPRLEHIRKLAEKARVRETLEGLDPGVPAPDTLAWNLAKKRG